MKWWVLGLIILAGVLRLWRINTDLLIHFDQGLHAFGSYRIWHDQEVKLLGHQTDVDGLFHGPFYYLLMAIPYGVSGGDPVVASAFQILLEMLTLPLFYLAVKKLFGEKTAVITLLVYAISYGMIGYSRWLSNVTPIIPLSHLLFYLNVCQKSSLKRNFLIGLGVGLVAQLNAAVGFTLILTVLVVNPDLRKPKSLVLYLLGILIPAIPQLLFEFRHNFVITKAFLAFSQGKKQGVGFSLLTVVNNVRVLLEEINKILVYPYRLMAFVVTFFALVNVWMANKYRWYFLLVLVPCLMLALFNRGAISFFFVYLLPVSLAVLIFGILKMPKIICWCILGVIIFRNGISFKQNIIRPSNALTPIGTANILTINDRERVVDWVYEKANGKGFSIWIYTIPYDLPEPWTYFFQWYGLKKYGYLPEQVSGFSPNDLKRSDYFFAIYEPDENRPQRLLDWLTRVENNFGKKIDSYRSSDGLVDFHKLK